jgi:glycosyltransferase involved in cell wall biosynthesis
MKKILIIDFCNYEDYQIGGHLTFAKSLMNAFGDHLALAGITTDKSDPVGRWIKKNIDGTNYDFFALARYNKNKTKYFFPDRLICFLLVRFYKSKILSVNIKNVFIQRQEILPAVMNFGIENICYRFPGLQNPISISKYWYGKYIAGIFDKLFFSGLKNAKTILATGDENAINEMILRSKGRIERTSVIKFPTRVNTDIFKPSDKFEARVKLNISNSTSVVVTTGRLAWFKGWMFMIDCFSIFEKKIPDSIFYIVGEGEDFQKIKDYMELKGLTGKIILAGKKNPHEIATLLNASDLFIMGSYKEGWSTSLSEAVACGIPSCVTNFSSAKEIIRHGENGYVIESHDVELFVQGMFKAVSIAHPIKNENIKVFASDKIKEDLMKVWNLL